MSDPIFAHDHGILNEKGLVEKDHSLNPHTNHVQRKIWNTLTQTRAHTHMRIDTDKDIGSVLIQVRKYNKVPTENTYVFVCIHTCMFVICACMRVRVWKYVRTCMRGVCVCICYPWVREISRTCVCLVESLCSSVRTTTDTGSLLRMTHRAANRRRRRPPERNRRARIVCVGACILDGDSLCLGPLHVTAPNSTQATPDAGPARLTLYF